MLAGDSKEESEQAIMSDKKPLDLNGSWEYQNVENLKNFLIGMEVGWAKQKLAASIAFVGWLMSTYKYLFCF